MGFLVLIGLVTALAWAAWSISHYAESQIFADPTERWVLLLCGLAYLLAALPIVLLPIDVASLEHNDGCGAERSSLVSPLQLAWYPVYVGTLTVGFVTNDFARCYVECGAISVRRRALLAWREVWLWYAYALAIAAALLLLLAWQKGVGNFPFWSSFYSILLGLLNLYGIGIFLFLAAHALAELPKRLLFLRSPESRQRLRLYRVGVTYHDVYAAHGPCATPPPTHTHTPPLLEAPKGGALAR